MVNANAKCVSFLVLTLFASFAFPSEIKSAQKAELPASRKPVLQIPELHTVQEDRIFGSMAAKPEPIENKSFWTWPVVAGVSVGSAALVAASVLSVIYFPRDSKADVHIRISTH